MNPDRYVSRKLYRDVVGEQNRQAVKEALKDDDGYYRTEQMDENNAEHISEQEIPKLFDAFYRREKSRNRKAGGSGLGLYIVKMIVELHHYECELKNTDQGIEVKIICKD